MSGRFETVALVTMASRNRFDNEVTTSKAPSMARTCGQCAIGMSTGPSSDIRVSPQSNRMNLICLSSTVRIITDGPCRPEDAGGFLLSASQEPATQPPSDLNDATSQQPQHWSKIMCTTPSTRNAIQAATDICRLRCSITGLE